MCGPGRAKQTHAFAERTAGRGWQYFALAWLNHQAPYQTVTQFYMPGVGKSNRIPDSSICVTMTNNHKQTAVITGASSGIGLGLTKGFLAAGFNVVANSRRVTAAGTLTPADDLLLVDGDVGEVSTARKLITGAE